MVKHAWLVSTTKYNHESIVVLTETDTLDCNTMKRIIELVTVKMATDRDGMDWTEAEAIEFYRTHGCGIKRVVYDRPCLL